MSRPLKFRTPFTCQHGYFRYAYWEPSVDGRSTAIVFKNGDRSCTCPTVSYKVAGPHEQILEEKGKNDCDLYENDICAAVFTTWSRGSVTAKSKTFNIHISVDSDNWFIMPKETGKYRFYPHIEDVIPIGNIHQHHHLLKNIPS